VRWCKKDATGECFPALKALLGLGLRERRVKVELLSGFSFIDEVVSLEGTDAMAVAIFSSQRRVPVAEIGFVAMAELA
jgi:hypothetical protein